MRRAGNVAFVYLSTAAVPAAAGFLPDICFTTSPVSLICQFALKMCVLNLTLPKEMVETIGQLTIILVVGGHNLWYWFKLSAHWPSYLWRQPVLPNI